MLENCQSAKERWGGVSKILDSWLQQRQDLIIEFCTISGVHDVNAKTNSSKENLHHFCELMVDYISAGHFEVYDHLIQEAEAFNDGRAMEIARKTYPKISESTEIALAFNDKYIPDNQGEQNTQDLARNLSKLGESLVARFELEDQLVENLHYAHEDIMANA